MRGDNISFFGLNHKEGVQCEHKLLQKYAMLILTKNLRQKYILQKQKLVTLKIFLKSYYIPKNDV